VRVPEPKEAPPPLTASPPQDIENLKKEIAKLTDDLFVADGKNELVDEFQDALKFILKFVKSDNPELYDTIKDNLDDYPAVLKLI